MQRELDVPDPSSTKQRDSNGAISNVTAPQPKLKIRLSGLGASSTLSSSSSKGKEREKSRQSNVNEGGQIGHGQYANGHTNGHHAQHPQPASSTENERRRQAQHEAEAAAQAAAQAEQQRIADEAEAAKQYAKDLAELPDIARQHLVPLTEIARRAIVKSFSDLQNLIEILPAQSDIDRKRSIVEYVISTRRQIVKLLVLLRWAKEDTKETERAINLIAFLQRQNFQLERAVESLKNIKEALAGARVRNYDLATAVDVLTSGTYTRLPDFLKESFVPPPRLTASDVLNLLQELESVIRFRLQLHEDIPHQMLQHTYRIHDGRVTFRCPGLFKAAFTLGGDALTDQWYLVDFSFDLAGRDISPEPSAPMREHILRVANESLAKSASEMLATETPSKNTEQADATSGTEVAKAEAASAPTPSKRSTAFPRIYCLLQSLCLNFQLEMLHYHAVQANSSPTVWQGRLNISLSKDRTSLEIRNAKPPAAPQAPSGSYGSSRNQPVLHFDESIIFTISKRGEGNAQSKAPSTSRRRQAVTSHLSSISQKLASVSIQAELSTSPAQQAVEKTLTCSTTRNPFYIDRTGRRVQPPQQYASNLPKKQERSVEYWTDSSLPALRDIEDILGECFSGAIR